MGEKGQKNAKTEVLTARTARALHTLSCQKGQSVHTARALHAHGHARLTAQLFFRFSVFTISRIKFKPSIGF